MTCSLKIGWRLRRSSAESLVHVPGPPSCSRRYCIWLFEADYLRSSSSVVLEETLGID